MVDITKPDYTYIWADRGSKDKPTDLKILQGWTAEIPPYQAGNWIEYRQDTAIRYLLQKGIPEWQDGMDYYANKSVVNHLGKIYIAKANSIGSAPSSTNNDWEDIIPDASTTVKGKISIATQDEVNAGEIDNKAVTPKTLIAREGTLDNVFLRKDQNLSDLTNVNIARSVLLISNLTNDKQAKASTTISTDNVYIEGGGNLDSNRTFKFTKRSTDAVAKIEGLTFTTLEGKPSTYPPSSHTHAWNTITGRPANGNSADLAHTHPVDQVTGSWPWNRLTGVPSTFNPASHTHPVNQVTGEWPWNRLTGVPSIFPTNWGSVQGKPSVYPTNWNSIVDRPLGFGSRFARVSRAVGTTYRNSSEHLMVVMATIRSGERQRAVFTINGEQLRIGNGDWHNEYPITFIIPPWGTYSLTGSASIVDWVEIY